MASKAWVLELPFSLVLFLVVLRLLRYLEIFPILCVPWVRASLSQTASHQHHLRPALACLPACLTCPAWCWLD